MKKKLFLIPIFILLTSLLAGCDKLLVFNSKGPQSEMLANVILLSIAIMIGVLVVVYALFAFVIVKYRATKENEDYEPPEEEGNKLLEAIWIIIPTIIVTFLSVVTVQSLKAVEGPPAGYDKEKPLIIYASSSNWKWHFSYPEEGIETVNYVNIPTNRNVEFRLYAFGPITSFWIPQLGGQKYAMSDMVTKLNLVAESQGEFIGKNTNFAGKGSAYMQFSVMALDENDYFQWVNEVQNSMPPLTEKEFDSLLEQEYVGRSTYSSTHLEFRPSPDMTGEGHHHGSSSESKVDDNKNEHTNHEEKKESNDKQDDNSSSHHH